MFGKIVVYSADLMYKVRLLRFTKRSLISLDGRKRRQRNTFWFMSNKRIVIPSPAWGSMESWRRSRKRFLVMPRQLLELSILGHRK